METPSLRVQTMAGWAAAHALNLIGTSNELLPFLMFQVGGEVTAQQFRASTFEECIAQARQVAAREHSADVIALAYDGFVTDEGVRSEAIFVEVYEAKAPQSFIFAQRYRPSRFGQEARARNAIFVASVGEPLVRPETEDPD